MTARGKREAKRSASPLVTNNHTCPALKGRNLAPWYFGPSGLGTVCLITRGDALRACPWLSYLAPLALSFVDRQEVRGAIGDAEGWLVVWFQELSCR